MQERRPGQLSIELAQCGEAQRQPQRAERPPRRDPARVAVRVAGHCPSTASSQPGSGVVTAAISSTRSAATQSSVSARYVSGKRRETRLGPFQVRQRAVRVALPDPGRRERHRQDDAQRLVGCDPAGRHAGQRGLKPRASWREHDRRSSLAQELQAEVPLADLGSGLDRRQHLATGGVPPGHAALEVRHLLGQFAAQADAEHVPEHRVIAVLARVRRQRLHQAGIPAQVL